ncbi:MAG: HAD hydrolase-like protein [bacterium]|nr:HAD hydrolase-like protein [bacterium]
MHDSLPIPRAILFDLDGVLITSLENHFFTWSTVLSDQGISVTRRDIALGEGEKAEVSMRRFFQEKAGITPSDEFVMELVNRKRKLYRENSPPQINPEAHGLLQKLKASNVLLGLVTGSARVNLESSLIPEEIALFSAIVSGEENLPGKPDPAPYLEAMKRLHCEPAEC